MRKGVARIEEDFNMLDLVRNVRYLMLVAKGQGLLSDERLFRLYAATPNIIDIENERDESFIP